MAYEGRGDGGEDEELFRLSLARFRGSPGGFPRATRLLRGLRAGPSHRVVAAGRVGGALCLRKLPCRRAVCRGERAQMLRRAVQQSEVGLGVRDGGVDQDCDQRLVGVGPALPRRA